MSVVDVERAPWFEARRRSRVLGAGPTRCGKSYLFRVMLKQQRHAIIVDSKHRWEWEDPAARYQIPIAYTREQLVEALKRAEQADGSPVIFRPRRMTFADFERGVGLAVKERNTELNYLWWLALTRGNTLVYHDELALDVSGSAFESQQPLWRELIVTGEGLGVGCWMASQRVRRLPLIASSESSYRFTFFMRERTDQEQVQAFLGGEIPWGVLAKEKYSFVWVSDAMLLSDAPLVPMRVAA